ncbi:helix-turn-helix domain-containing protein, partial [Mycobacterium sp.]|uniref:helix-turn-helix domain-containing protein n=1 Tax=Mycobacterium sp. TaxID=1785 RepID=UPI003C7112EB
MFVWFFGNVIRFPAGKPSASAGGENAVSSFRRVVGGRVYVVGVSRFRLLPSVEQAGALAEHCRHARFVWNLAVEQQR